MATTTARRTTRAGIRGYIEGGRPVARNTKIFWTDDEKEKVIRHAVPLFKQMVDEGHWSREKPSEWWKELLGAAQDLALPAGRRRPLAHLAHLDKVQWFLDGVLAEHAKLAGVADVLREAKEKRLREMAEAQARRELRGVKPPPKQLSPAHVPPPRDKIWWSEEEKAAIVAAGAEIMRADPTRSFVSTIKKAMEEALPPGRHRKMDFVGVNKVPWFVEGVAAYLRENPEAEPEPEEVEEVEAAPVEAPAPAEVPVAVVSTAPVLYEATAEATANAIQAIGVVANLNRAVAESLRSMLADGRATLEAMATMAKEQSAIREILARVVAQLDPSLVAPEPAPAAPEPAANGAAAIEAKPAGPPPPPQHLRPKIAIVAPHMTQAKKIEEALEPYVEVRIFENSRLARNKNFSNSQYVLFTQMAGHTDYQKAKQLLGSEHVFFLGKSGMETIIDQAMRISHKHVKELEAREKAEKKAEEVLANGTDRVHG